MARQALTIAGAVVGTMFGAPQLGFMIGSMIGNAVDPVTIQGPKIGDLAVQTSRDGVPRPIVFGTAAVTGNIIDRSTPKIVKKKERSGKGGPVTVTERVYMSYAIRVCEGPATSISRIWENEKLVYDATPGSTIVKDSTKFLTKVTFYMGEESQLPDPTLEAIHGVGNTPAHRGTCYAVWKDKDLTDFGGAIPQYRFEVNGDAGLFGDPYGTYVASLLHFDEGDGATSFTDEVAGAWNTTGVTTSISSTQLKFGASSAYNDGSTTGAYGFKTFSDWNNEKVFTAEAWIYRTSLNSSQQYFFCLSPRSGNTAACRVILGSTNKYLNLWVEGVGTDSSTTAPPLNTWSHLAMCSDGSNYYLYLDGVLICQVAGVIPNTTNTLYWQPGSAVDGGTKFTGYIDEVRLTKGICRYPGGTSFTPPTAAFPNP